MISVSASASTVISPSDETRALSSIKALVSLSRTTESPVIPTPTSAPPPEPETDKRSVSLSARTATFCAESLSDWFTDALSPIKACVFEVVFCAITTPWTDVIPAPPAESAPELTLSDVRARISILRLALTSAPSPT